MKTLSALLVAFAVTAQAAERQVHSFERIQLTDRYYSEGINAADVDGDGRMDAIHGPFWFAGPDFKEKKLIYQAAPQNREGYANNFFSWPYDFNKDGLVDVLTAGFPGTPAFVYQNPGRKGHEAPWPKHQVFDWVSNESPHFTNLVGDAVPELVCTRDGRFGYVSVNPANGLEPWNFHPISERIAPEKFGHGLGVGDVSGDGRLDVLMKDGWFEQPEDLTRGLWTLHKASFAQRGGAEMFACDVDGDGDSDVITSLAAHEYGLAWHEQTPQGFTEHLIMGDRPGLNRYGVFFSELHSVQLADMDGDGLKDIVTGKTYWSHHKKSHGWDDGAVVYWFKLVRGKDGVDWLPMKADGDSGIGRQLVIHDINGDKNPDILAGGMKGAHILIHHVKNVSEAEWQTAQPKRLEMNETPPVTGKPAPIGETTGRVPDALEGETIAANVKVSAGTAKTQDMRNFTGSRWSGGAQLFWSGGRSGDSLDLGLMVPADGSYTLETVFTRAPDFAIVQLSLDGRDLGPPLDLYQFAKVTTTGVLEHLLGPLTAGTHSLVVRITGTNPNAVQSRLVGLDYVRLIKSE
ncbi:MAG: VCBS repeat-containing protein [Verrucomicrobiaceae bacterium]|nr:VCBS repeat-containing protein [Verrucomicrobiaceae bacterium]